MSLLLRYFHELNKKKDAYADTSSENINKIFYQMRKVTLFWLSVNQTAKIVFHFPNFRTVLITL